MPKAYVIVDVDVSDPVAYDRYRQLSTRALEVAGGRFIVRGGSTEVLEGDHQPGRVVVLEFPDVETARRWWTSPEYEEAKAVRRGAASGSFILVEGTD